MKDSMTLTPARRLCQEAIDSMKTTGYRMKSEEMLAIVDLLFDVAGIPREDITEERAIEALGHANFEKILKFYSTLSNPTRDRLELLTSDSDDYGLSSSEGDADFDESIPTVPDIEHEPENNLKRIQDTSLREQWEVKRVKTSDAQNKYKAETEIALSRIFDLGKVPPVAEPEISPDAPYHGPAVITMTGFGELGRWGNQILQYAFLKICATKTKALIQVPFWIGSALFDLTDETVQRRFPAVIESPSMKANSTFTDDFLKYIKLSNSSSDVVEIGPSTLEGEMDHLKNVDIWGWFQWHTKYYLPYQQLIQKTFQISPSIREHYDTAIRENLRGSGNRTVVGLHLRLGDYKNISASSFGYCAPTEWYLEWLAKLWPTLNNPVLFVASDEVDTVLKDFATYNPVTSDQIGATPPHNLKGKGAGFFGDWYTLTQCDVLAISNSTFSFTACMMNQRPGAKFFRAHYDQKIIPFDPWDSEPIIHRDISDNKLVQLGNTLKVVYNTQGTRGVVKNVFYELPYYGIRNVIMKTVLRSRATSSTKIKERDQVVPSI